MGTGSGLAGRQPIGRNTETAQNLHVVSKKETQVAPESIPHIKHKVFPLLQDLYFGRINWTQFTGVFLKIHFPRCSGIHSVLTPGFARWERITTL
jgi:hypothetical protein